MKRLMVTFFIIAIIYCNAAAIWNPIAAKKSLLQKLPLSIHLPAPRLASDLFRIFGIFSGYETINRELALEGKLIDSQKKSPGEWLTLNMDEFLPFFRGERQTRLWAARHGSVLGAQGRQIAWRSLTHKIRQRHNRLHPEKALRKVRIVQYVWPRSIYGYEHSRQKSKQRKYRIFTQKTKRQQ